MKPPRQPICQRHRGDPVVAVCRRCSEGMCDACWQHVLADAPVCPMCAFELQSKGARFGSVVVSSVLAAAALAFFASRHMSSGLAVGTAVGVAIGAVVLLVVAAVRWRSAPREVPVVRHRDEEDVLVPEPLAPGDNPYRVRFVRVASRSIPRLSGRATVGIMALSFVATATLVPFALRLPRWEEAEVVMGGWWLVGAVTFAWLLHRGARLADDHVYRAPWDQPVVAGSSSSSSSGSSSGGSWWSSSRGSGGGCADAGGCLNGGEVAAEGCAGILIGVLLAAVAFAASWLFVELVAPLVFFLFYAVALRAIARVTRDGHGCAGHPGKAALWGAVWASVYVLPLALAVWGAHALLPGAR